MKDIINKFQNKIKKEESNNLYYIYNGDNLNENQIIKDINEKKINILVYNNKNKENKENKKDIISSEIICPEWKENILININNYKIYLNECKMGIK